MSDNPSASAVSLLTKVSDANRSAINKLCEAVYDDLRRTAQRLMQQERPNHTLQASALVNEALIRVLGADLSAGTEDRALFFAAATRAMRRVLVEHARRRGAAKRGKGWQRRALDDLVDAFEDETTNLEQLDTALEELQRLQPRQYQIVQLRFFGGLAIDEIAKMMSLSQSSVEKDLQKAREFLHQQISLSC